MAMKARHIQRKGPRDEFACRSLIEVRDEFNRRNGTNLPIQRVHEALKRAERKIADALGELVQEAR